jgi:hypothetical protein
MRHLGKVREHTMNKFTKEVLLTEMTARYLPLPLSLSL